MENNAEEYTDDKVNNGIAYGTIKAECDKSGSQAYDIIQKLYRRFNDVWVIIPFVFRCSRCYEIIKTKSGIGTQPLIRHKEVACTQLTLAQKKEYADARTARLVKLAEEKASKMAKPKTEAQNEDAVPSTSAEPSQPVDSDNGASTQSVGPKADHIIEISSGLAAVFAEMSQIACLWGPVPSSKFDNMLLSTTNCEVNKVFLHKFKKLAKESSGIEEPRVVLHKIVQPPEETNDDSDVQTVQVSETNRAKKLKSAKRARSPNGVEVQTKRKLPKLQKIVRPSTATNGYKAYQQEQASGIRSIRTKELKQAKQRGNLTAVEVPPLRKIPKLQKIVQRSKESDDDSDYQPGPARGNQRINKLKRAKQPGSSNSVEVLSPRKKTKQSACVTPVIPIESGPNTNGTGKHGNTPMAKRLRSKKKGK